MDNLITSLLPSASPASLMKSEVVRGKNKTHQHHDTLNYCLNTQRPITAKLGDISKYEPSAGDSDESSVRRSFFEN